MIRGILLAGGRGTRLYPVTTIASKQLQPIYDKPLIYYPLTTMLLAGIQEIMIITTPEDVPRFRELLGDGSQWGVSLQYAAQDKPRGIAEALIIGEEFIAGDSVMLMLGDNFVYGRLDFLREAIAANEGGTVFAYPVNDPTAYGVIEFDANYNAISVEEKPTEPKSNWAVPGMYIYKADCAAKAKALAPSGRGELEITDVTRSYLEEGRLKVKPMGRGIAWLDTGTSENLLGASNFVHALQSRQGLVIGSPEEAAMRMGYIDADTFRTLVGTMPRSAYREYLERIIFELEEA